MENDLNAELSVASRLKLINEKVDKAAKQWQRGSVEVVAVSKFHDAALAEQAIDAGHRVFGENRVREAMEKWPGLKNKCEDVSLHLIGPLQTNKVKDAVALFDMIETVDRMKLAKALYKEMERTDRFLDCLIQVNTGEEEQKAGIVPQEADAFIEEVVALGLPVKGLMCIPPVGESPGPHFALLRTIAERHDLQFLSMGMSSDFEVAISMGATHVRIGTAIFGERAT